MQTSANNSTGQDTIDPRKDTTASRLFMVSRCSVWVADQIAPWIPGGLTSLGTDGFGRSDSRPYLRRFFEVDAECTSIGVLYALSQRGQIPASVVAGAIRDLGVNPEKTFGECV